MYWALGSLEFYGYSICCVIYVEGEGRVTADGQPLEQLEVEDPPWVKAELRRQRQNRRKKICIIVSIFVTVVLIGGGTALGVLFLGDKVTTSTPTPTIGK